MFNFLAQQIVSLGHCSSSSGGGKWQNGSSSNITQNKELSVCMDWVDRPQNYKRLYEILQLLQGSHLDFPLKTLKLGWVAFNSLKCQLKCLVF